MSDEPDFQYLGGGAVTFRLEKMCIRDRVLIECGKLLQRGGYKIKVLNTINFKKSMRYNPFACLLYTSPGMKTSLLQGGRTTTKRSRTRKENKSHEKID